MRLENAAKSLNQIVSFQDVWKIIKRRKWWLILTPIVVIPIAIEIGLLQPKAYQASTTIIIDPPKIPGEYVMAESVELRLDHLKRQMVRAEVLRPIIEEFALDGEEGQSESEDAVEYVQSAIGVNLVRVDAGGGGQQRRNVVAFVLSYEASDPYIAMQVTNRLAELFMEENRKRREQYVAGAAEFLEDELGNLRSKLEQHEKAISGFKGRFMGELSEQLGANSAAKAKFEAELGAVLADLDTAREERRLLDQQLIDLGSGDGGPDTRVLEARLEELNKTLTHLLSLFKEGYPDVMDKRAEIKLLEEQLAQQRLARQQSKKEAGTSPDPVASATPQARKVQTDLSWLNFKMKRLNDREERLRGLILEYQERMDRTPLRDQELLALERDYNNTQNSYNALLDKKLKAQISQNVETRLAEEEFRVLEPATLPRKPIRPDVLDIIGFAIALGLGCAVGLVLLVEYTDTSFRKSEDLGRASGLKVLCTISTFPKRRWRAKRHHQTVTCPPSFIAEHPHSVVAEQYRILCTQITRFTKNARGTVFAFTSAVKKEGKSTTALNVAISMGRDLKKSTLLIDADAYQPPNLSDLREGRFGLVDVLTAKATLESALVRYPLCNLAVLPMGRIGDINPIEFLGRDVMRDFVQGLRDRFDYIFIDSTPVLPGVAASLVAEAADAVVFVVGAERTPRALILQALEKLRENTMLGVVLNNTADPEVPSKYYYPYYTHV